MEMKQKQRNKYYMDSKSQTRREGKIDNISMAKECNQKQLHENNAACFRKTRLIKNMKMQKKKKR